MRAPLLSSLAVLLLAAAPLAHAQTNAEAAPTAPSSDTASAMAPAAADDNAPAPQPTTSIPTTIPTTLPQPSAAPAPASAPFYAAPNNTGVSSLPPGLSGGGPGGQQPEDIADIRPPFFFLTSWYWFWIGLATLAFIGLLTWLWIHFKPHRLLAPKTAYELTLERLEKARAMLKEEDPQPYAVFVSETIRSYLGQRFQAPSTRRTTEEFLRQMKQDAGTPLAEHRTLLQGFLQACDLVKFARYRPTLAELEEVQQRAWTFVTATKPVPASLGARS